MSGRAWTEKEILYLEKHWVTTSVDVMAAYLGRTRIAVMNKGRLYGLGRQIDGNGELMPVKMINEAFGKTTVSHATADYMERTGLTVRQFRFGKANRYSVNVDEFWAWLKLHQNKYPVTSLEPMALGPEPDWVAEARRTARKFPRGNSGKKWTEHDDMLLMSMARQHRPIKEICAALKRSENAVRCHATFLWQVDLSYAIDRRRRPWTADDDRRLVELAYEGRCSMEISQMIDRSEHMVRIRLNALCGTSSVEALMERKEAETHGKRKRGRPKGSGARGRKRKAG